VGEQEQVFKLALTLCNVSTINDIASNQRFSESCRATSLSEFISMEAILVFVMNRCLGSCEIVTAIVKRFFGVKQSIKCVMKFDRAVEVLKGLLLEDIDDR
jgi:hypothetical protein